MDNPIFICAAMVLAFGWGGSPASAEQCLAQSTPPTYTAGMAVPQVCDTHGTQKVMTVDEDGNYVAGGGGGGGDACPNLSGLMLMGVGR